MTTSVAPRVPELLIGDAFRITQVLTNLLGNAVKFTDDGRVHLRIDALPARRRAGARCASWSRTPASASPEDQLPLLFESFTQADTSTTRKYGGAGLGLAISRELVQLMGGTIAADSSPGAGSTFTVVLTLDLPDPELFG